MSKSVYQVVLNKTHREELNAGGWGSEIGMAYLNVTSPMSESITQEAIDTAIEKGIFVKSAVIEQDLDLDQIFHVGNVNPRVHGFVKSMSVGDVVVEENGVAHIVLPCGFDKIEFNV